MTIKCNEKIPADFKARIALEAIRETRTTAELCPLYGVHVTMLGRWRQQAIEHIKTGFSDILRVASNCGFLKSWNLRESSESNSDLWSVWVLLKHSVIAPLNVSNFE
jgi:transposase-like protein